MIALRRLLFVVRLAGFIAIAAMAVTTMSGLDKKTEAPEPPSVNAKVATSSAKDLAAALSDAELNSITADYAPQQQVVNGWAARDLLSIIGEQNDESNELLAAITANQAAVADTPGALAETSNRYAETLVSLAVLLVLAVCWNGLTSRLRWDPATTGSTPRSVEWNDSPPAPSTPTASATAGPPMSPPPFQNPATPVGAPPTLPPFVPAPGPEAGGRV